MKPRTTEEKHHPLPRDLQQLVLSYVDLSEKNDKEPDDDFDLTKTALILPFTLSYSFLMECLQEMKKAYQSGFSLNGAGSAGLASLLLILGVFFLIPSGAVSAVSGTLVGVCEFSIFAKHQLSKKIENYKNNKQAEDFYYFINHDAPGKDRSV